MSVHLHCLEPDQVMYNLAVLTETFDYALIISSTSTWANERKIMVDRMDGFKSETYEVEMRLLGDKLHPLDCAIAILRDIGMIDG